MTPWQPDLPGDNLEHWCSKADGHSTVLQRDTEFEHCHFRMARVKNTCRKPIGSGYPAARFPIEGAGVARKKDKKKACNLCGLWVAKKVFRRHLRECHCEDGVARRFNCADCQYSAKRHSDLMRHRQAKHQGCYMVTGDVPYAPEVDTTAAYVPEGVEEGGANYTPTPKDFPDVTAGLARLTTQSPGVMPCQLPERLQPTAREVMCQALGDAELLSDLQQLLDTSGYVMMTKDEFRDEKLEARKRGAEEERASHQCATVPVEEEIQRRWEASQQQPIPGKWGPIPRQMTINNSLLAFDLRMRVLDVPNNSVPKAPVKCTRRKKKVETPSTATTAATTATAMTEEGPAVLPELSPPEEITLFIGTAEATGDIDNPIKLE